MSIKPLFPFTAYKIMARIYQFESKKEKLKVEPTNDYVLK